MENNPIKKPEIVVFAGPNGSGKSTITDLLRPPMLPYVNADEIQRVLDCDNMEAAKIAEKRREDYLDKHKGFCFETVLSTDRNLKLLKRAKDADFFVRCYYVLTADPQINVARVVSMNWSRFAMCAISMIIPWMRRTGSSKNAKRNIGIVRNGIYGKKTI